MATKALENVRLQYRGDFSWIYRSFETVEAAHLYLREVKGLKEAQLFFRMDGPEYTILTVHVTKKTCLVRQVNGGKEEFIVSFKQIKEGRFNAI